MPVEISIQLEGSFSHDIDLGISRKKKDFLWYYKPGKDGKRFKTGELLENLIKSNRPEKKNSMSGSKALEKQAKSLQELHCQM